ncbi:hypothetical protein SAMN04487970_1008149 [Paenibacillus tianmuensis]|uniref:Uncharacterized protein n=1 Tax=Paenibacillus tianmuensis TaxID=624147 RepID=A0A1G4QRE8_9BACL|nr:hypothetical protein [Paenibacillus tianmuensis]SCW47214.1 hypothetical protein SAMN04487970_1008149 [Paenibacillus tianmuensis]
MMKKMLLSLLMVLMLISGGHLAEELTVTTDQFGYHGGVGG